MNKMYKQIVKLFTIFFLVIFLFGCSKTNLTNNKPIQRKQEKQSATTSDSVGLKLPAPIIINKTINNFYKIVKVVDGDTIDVNIDGKTERIRMIGVNTPETVDPRKPVECFGREASDKAKEWLSGQEIRLESDTTQTDRDKYNRLLRYAWRKDGLFYNLEIIKRGFAYGACRQFPPPVQ